MKILLCLLAIQLASAVVVPREQESQQELQQQLPKEIKEHLKQLGISKEQFLEKLQQLGISKEKFQQLPKDRKEQLVQQIVSQQQQGSFTSRDQQQLHQQFTFNPEEQQLYQSPSSLRSRSWNTYKGIEKPFTSEEEESSQEQRGDEYTQLSESEEENIVPRSSRFQRVPYSRRYGSNVEQEGSLEEEEVTRRGGESMEQGQQELITRDIQNLMGLDRLGKHICERGRTPLALTKRSPLNVAYGLKYLCGIIDVETNILTSRVQQDIRFVDKRIKWNPVNYKGITKYNIKHFQTWTPDIMLYNSMDKDVKQHGNKVVNSNGLITWQPLTTFKSVCDVSKKQEGERLYHCKLLIGSWTHDAHTLRLRSDGFKIFQGAYQGCPTKVINHRVKVIPRTYGGRVYDVFVAEFDLVPSSSYKMIHSTNKMMMMGENMEQK